MCLAVKYGGISALAEHANRGTFLNRGCITVLVGTGKVAPEPSQGQYLWGLTVGNRRVGDLDTVSGRQLTQPDMDVQNLVLARGYATNDHHYTPPSVSADPHTHIHTTEQAKLRNSLCWQCCLAMCLAQGLMSEIATCGTCNLTPLHCSTIFPCSLLRA